MYRAEGTHALYLVAVPPRGIPAIRDEEDWATRAAEVLRYMHQHRMQPLGIVWVESGASVRRTGSVRDHQAIISKMVGDSALRNLVLVRWQSGQKDKPWRDLRYTLMDSSGDVQKQDTTSLDTCREMVAANTPRWLEIQLDLSTSHQILWDVVPAYLNQPQGGMERPQSETRQPQSKTKSLLERLYTWAEVKLTEAVRTPEKQRTVKTNPVGLRT